METMRYILLVNGLLAIVTLAYYVLLRRETFFSANRLILWLGLASALVLPLVELPDWRPQPMRSVMQQTAQVILPHVLQEQPVFQPDVTITFPNLKTYRAFQERQKQVVWSWKLTFIVLYILVAFGLLIQFSTRLLSLRKLIRQSEQEPYTDFILIQNEGISSPFSFFNWVFLNPGQHSADELEQILRHERVHVREQHSVDVVAAELVCIIFWFNPAAYLFRHLLQQTLEFSADRAVLTEGVDAKLYQYNLLKVSLASGQLTITNQFSGPTLRQRIKMINCERSSPLAWWRYTLWAIIMGSMLLACRYKIREDVYIPNQSFARNPLAANTPTRARVIDLEDRGTWYRHLALFQDKHLTHVVESNPVILQLKADHFVLPEDYKYESVVYIDGKEASVVALEKLSPEFISEVFVMHQWENMEKADPQAKPYQILIQTSPKPVVFNKQRKQFFTLLQAAAISQYPLGESFSFNMNQLLEATFFHNKNALVERSKDEHLHLYDEYAGITEVFINNLPATPADVKTIHVREVARLYTKEQPYTEWFRADYPSPRFSLYIETTPKRATRDSSYYVFSPFYSGDF